MDKIRRLIRRSPSYEAIDGGSTSPDEESRHAVGATRFSWVAYSVFLLIGIAMLWAWNMFLAAGPYFQRRFQSNKTILTKFQAAETSVSTLAGLGSMLVLTKLQANANYPKRIFSSLLMNVVVSILLALSTKVALGASADAYFGFLITLVLISSLATGFMQNGAFAFVSGYARPEYMQAIMFGQAVAGVLPPLVQMISVLSTNEYSGQDSSTSAFAYFLTATGVSSATLLAFFYLAANHRPEASNTTSVISDPPEDDEDDLSHSNLTPPERKSVSVTYLARRLLYRASAVFLTFGITMVFPVFTQQIVSVGESESPFLQKAAFIPLAFLVWNTGDLIGRLVPIAPILSLAHRPKILLLFSVCRLVFIPLYLACNIQLPDKSPPLVNLESPNLNDTSSILGRSKQAAIVATVGSDIFYLLLVQFPFGFTNGYLGSCCMMGAGADVEEDEREAAGGFMGLMLVAGLAVGSLCSFFISSSV